MRLWRLQWRMKNRVSVVEITCQVPSCTATTYSQICSRIRRGGGNRCQIWPISCTAATVKFQADYLELPHKIQSASTIHSSLLWRQAAQGYEMELAKKVNILGGKHPTCSSRIGKTRRSISSPAVATRPARLVLNFGKCLSPRLHRSKQPTSSARACICLPAKPCIVGKGVIRKFHRHEYQAWYRCRL